MARVIQVDVRIPDYMPTGDYPSYRAMVVELVKQGKFEVTQVTEEETAT